MKILLGVSGSISAYKTFDLVRELIKLNHSVKVILTEGALQFVKPEVYGYLGVEKVYLAKDDFKNSGVLHVELSRWADTFLIAPTSANTLSRLASGAADDLLTSVFLAYENSKPIIISPAMNTQMLNHPFVEENIKKIEKLKTLPHLLFLDSNAGELLCGELGKGKLPEIRSLIAILETYTTVKNNKKVLISTGASITPLDPVRYLTNSSSGVTGFHLAYSLLKLGFQVSVVAGIHSTHLLDDLIKHPHFKLIRAKSVHDFKNHIMNDIKSVDYYFSSAALSDIEFHEADEKIKKDQIQNHIEVKPAPDILKSIVELNLKNLKIIGFAAETNLTKEMLLKKYQSKPVNILIGTKVHNGLNQKDVVQGFENDFADYRFFIKDEIVFEGRLEKKNLAEKILGFI